MVHVHLRDGQELAGLFWRHEGGHSDLSHLYIADLLLLPLFAFIITEMLKAKDAAGLEKAHTLGFFYAISFLLFTLVLTSPTIQSLVLVFVAYLWALTVAKVSVHSRVESRDWEKQRRKKE